MKTIFLDFGNVVAFFDHGLTVGALARFTDLTPEELFARLYGNDLEDDHDRGRLPTAEFVRRAKEAGRLRCTDAEFLSAFTGIFRRNPAVCDLVPELAARYRLVLASNTNAPHYATFTTQFRDVLGHFSHLVTSFDAGAKKPDPAFFAYAQRFAGADPAECAFADDLPENVRAARRHGWRGVLYHPGYDLVPVLAGVGIKVPGSPG